MFIYLWKLTTAKVEVRDVNKAFVNNSLPPMAMAISPHTAFRRAYRSYSSTKHGEFQAHTISSDKGVERIAIVNKNIKNLDEIDLDQVASMILMKKTGAHLLLYRCGCGKEQELSIMTNVCPACSKDVPSLVVNIKEKYKFHVSRFDNESRSTFYSGYLRKMTGSISMSSHGRPYMVENSQKGMLDRIKDAMNEVGDDLLIMKVTDSAEAGKIVNMTLIDRLNHISDEMKEWDKDTRDSTKESRIAKLNDLRKKAMNYRTIIQGLGDSVEDKIDVLVKKITGTLNE